MNMERFIFALGLVVIIAIGIRASTMLMQWLQ